METIIPDKVCKTCDNVGSRPGPCGWSMPVCIKWGYIIGVEVPWEDEMSECSGWKEIKIIPLNDK